MRSRASADAVAIAGDGVVVGVGTPKVGVYERIGRRGARIERVRVDDGREFLGEVLVSLCVHGVLGRGGHTVVKGCVGGGVLMRWSLVVPRLLNNGKRSLCPFLSHLSAPLRSEKPR